MSELKPCPLCHSKEVSICYDLKRNGDVACFICGCSADINAWDQRQPHPDTKRLDYFEQAGWSISVSAPTLREAIDKAMEQEK